MGRFNPCSLDLFSSCLHVDINTVFILLRWKTQCVFLSFIPHPVPLRWEGSSGDQAMTLVTVWDHHPLEIAAGSSELSSMHTLSLCPAASFLHTTLLLDAIWCANHLEWVYCCLLTMVFWLFSFLSSFTTWHFHASGHSWTSHLIGCLGCWTSLAPTTFSQVPPPNTGNLLLF